MFILAHREWTGKRPKRCIKCSIPSLGLILIRVRPSPILMGWILSGGGVNFVNPPYGRELPKWIEKGYDEWLKGRTVVFLVPSRTDTRWWHDFCMKADEMRFIKGRLKFDDQKNSAPFPSAIVVFRRKTTTNTLFNKGK